MHITLLDTRLSEIILTLEKLNTHIIRHDQIYLVK